MTNIFINALAVIALTIFYIPAGQPGEPPKTYVIENDTVTLKEDLPENQDFSEQIFLVEYPENEKNVIQHIRGKSGEPTTCSVLVTFVIE